MMTRLSPLSWPPQSVTQITPQQKIQFSGTLGHQGDRESDLDDPIGSRSARLRCCVAFKAARPRAVIETVALGRFISTKFSISAFSRVCD